MKKQNKKGFTLVELVIVIAVIAILAAVLIPTFTTVIANANKSAALQEGSALKTEILTLYQGDFNEYCNDYNTKKDASTLLTDKKITADAPLLIEGMDGYEKDKGGAAEKFGDFAQKIDGEINITYASSAGTITYTTTDGYEVTITAESVEVK